MPVAGAVASVPPVRVERAPRAFPTYQHRQYKHAKSFGESCCILIVYFRCHHRNSRTDCTSGRGNGCTSPVQRCRSRRRHAFVPVSVVGRPSTRGARSSDHIPSSHGGPTPRFARYAGVLSYHRRSVERGGPPRVGAARCSALCGNGTIGLLFAQCYRGECPIDAMRRRFFVSVWVGGRAQCPICIENS